MKSCKLCEKAKGVSSHHVIPKNIIKAINPKSELKDLTVDLCNHCHREIHFSFVHHLIMTKKFDGYNRLHAIKYSLLKRYLLDKHKLVFNKFQKWWKIFLEFEVEEMSNPNREIPECPDDIKAEAMKPQLNVIKQYHNKISMVTDVKSFTEKLTKSTDQAINKAVGRMENQYKEYYDLLILFVHKYKFMTEEECQEVACQFDHHVPNEPFSWHVVYLELINNTKLGRKMLMKMKLQLLKEEGANESD